VTYSAARAAFNRALQITDEAEFVRFMLADIPPPPAEAAAIRAANAGRASAAA
jgi:hydroxyacylglutathione hydrolase